RRGEKDKVQEKEIPRRCERKEIVLCQDDRNPRQNHESDQWQPTTIREQRLRQRTARDEVHQGEGQVTWAQGQKRCQLERQMPAGQVQAVSAGQRDRPDRDVYGWRCEYSAPS